MKFSEFIEREEPAYEVFDQSMNIVFDKDDGNIEYLERISKEARLVYLLWCFDGEIHNGGFDQLFFNSLGDHCSEILDSLQFVGAVKSVELLKKAMAWFPNSLPSTDREKRWQQMEPYEDDEEYEEALDQLDDQFYKYEDNLAELLNQYVRQHA